jgi:hypothetical protein
MRLKAAAAVAMLMAALGTGVLTTHADQPAGAEYRKAVADAYAIVIAAQPGDAQAAQQAASLLKAGTGTSQPEILADLAKAPPDFKDAAARLLALEHALDNPAATSDPADAQAKLHQVLSMSRYDALHRPPSALDRLSQWVQDRIRELLRFLFGGNSVGGVLPDWVLYLIGALIILAVAIVVFRSAGGRIGGDYDDVLPGGPRPPADYFAEADRLAAKGDRVGAIRALCAAVAGTLAGQQTWEGSPLTVREIFSRSEDPASLRPLLLPFEAAVYGGRDVDQATYDKALAAAAPFRLPLEAAA